MRKTEWLRKLSGIFYAMLIAGGVTVLSFFEAFTLLDEWVNDVFERLTLTQTARQVVLVHAPADSQTDGNQTWLPLLDKLEEKQPKQVVFTFMPKQVSAEFYCQAHRYGNVFFARSVQRDGRKKELEPLPTVPANCPIQFGLVDIPPHTHGIHRQQTAVFRINNQSYSALEIIAAEHFFGKKLLEPDTQHQQVWLQQNGQYRVQFGHGLDDFPQIQLDRILKGGLVTELIKDRSVIIGLTTPSRVPGLHTPLSMTHEIMISMSEYQALALNTLLTDAHIILLNIKIEWLVLFILMLVNLWIYQTLTIYQTLRATLIVMGCYVVLAWLFYHYAQIFLPLVEMIVAQSLLYLFDFQYKSMTSDRALRETLVDSSFKIGDRVNSESFASDEYWSQLVVMSHEILNLSRTIILEWPPNKKRVKEIKALHCTIADIAQRSCYKKPYSTAQQKKGMLHLKQALLESNEIEEEQYLVPLWFGEEVQGFWVLAIETGKPPLRFEVGVKDLALQMGESLYHRQQWLLRHLHQNALTRYFRVEQGELLHKALDKSITALEHRLIVLENIMDDLETPTILYDVFGTAIQVNKSMKALSHTFGLTPEKMSLLGFLMEISQIDMETAKNYFRHLMLEQGKIVRQVKLSGAIERFLVLNMQLFYYQDDIDGIETNIKKGILCQLVDVTKIKLRSTLKEQVAERLIYQFRNDMQSILMASKLLTNDKAGEAEKQMVGKILNDKVNNHVNILAEVEEQLKVDLDTADTDSGVYPIDPKAPVFEAMESLAERAVDKQLKLHQELPALVSLVFAAPNGLTTVISHLLSLLIDDAEPNTQMTIGMEEREGWLTYTFKNTGFGIPNERLQQYLFDTNANVSTQFEAVRQAIELITAWQGTLTAESEVGQGISFQLRLKSFI
jgi:CHASE2 domain-containing sensor protein/signal transduction histidine kinase